MGLDGVEDRALTVAGVIEVAMQRVIGAGGFDPRDPRRSTMGGVCRRFPLFEDFFPCVTPGYRRPSHFLGCGVASHSSRLPRCRPVRLL